MRKLFYFSNLFTLCLLLTAGSVKAATSVITTNPSDATVCSGVVAMFSVATSDTPSFVWQEYNGTTWTTLHDGGLYSGTTTNMLSVSGTTTITGYKYRAVANSLGGASDTSTGATLTVNPLPVVGTTLGNPHVCVGSSTTYSNTVAGGVWSSLSASIATVSVTGDVHGVAHGVDSIRYTITNSCGSAVASTAITVDTVIVAAPIAGPVTVCVGASINLSNAYTGGTWTASNGKATVNASGMVSGVTAGVDTITYSFSNACGLYTSTKVITVEVPTSAGTITGTSPICSGTWAAYTATVPGGVWLSNDASVATVDLSGFVTGRAQGSAIISYMFNNSCGSSVATATVNIERAVSMITGSDSVGLGMMTTFSDTVTGGIWTSNNASIASVDSFTGVVTGVASGNTTIVYTATNICGTTQNNKTIEVGIPGSAGTITGVDSVCQGSSITLTSTVLGGVWTSSNASATVNVDGVVTGVTGGTRDTLSYTVTDGFGSSVVTKVIYVNRPPVITVTGPTGVIAMGALYTLVATPAGGHWVSLRDSAVTFISANSFVAVKGDTTMLVYTVSNTCGTSKDTFYVNLPDFTAVQNVATNNNVMTVFPNPNNGSFVLNIASNVKETAHVVISNMVGAVVNEMDVVTNNNATVTLAQPAGVYFVSAVTANGKYTARVVVAK